MEQITESPVLFTQHAIEEINRLMKEEGFDKNSYLRIGVKGGGCSGLTYILGFDQRQDSDEEYEFDGLPFFFFYVHGIYLLVMFIDLHDVFNLR
jgi:iron-sulfur cluster assembly protein